MNQPRYLQMVRTNRFELIYRRWKKRKLTQAEAGEQLEMSERTFRRYVVRYEEEGKQGLADRRVWARRRLGELHRRRFRVLWGCLHRDCYPNRNIRHFYEAYEEIHGGTRGYIWVKRCLQDAGAVPRGRRHGPHRELRERKGQEGMMIHQGMPVRTDGFVGRCGIWS